VIDLHCHVLAGIDDGPDTVAESVELARAAERAGIETIVATPHVSSRYRNDSQTIARLVTALRERLREEGVGVDIRPGAELALTRVSELEADELSRLTLGGGEWLLVEPPFTPVAPGLEGALVDLRRSGCRIVLAHPERCPAFQREPRMLRSLASAGFLMSITAGSFSGRFGNEVKRFAHELLREGLVHNVASDAHDLRGRPPGIAEHLAQAKLSGIAAWLAEEVPRAILTGAEIPPAPAPAPPEPTRGRLSGWLRR
jgi:protein-tyrosine phosphatase